MSLKASISGIRGIVGDSLTPQVLVNYLSAFSRVLPDGAVLLGRDSRPTGKMILNIVKGVLNACGRDVVDLGIVPTPVVLFGVLQDGYAGGIIITASHNPSEWNALKFVNDKGKFLSPAEFEKLSIVYDKLDFKYFSHDKVGKEIDIDNITSMHISKIISFIDIKLIKKSRFKVALDAVNGAGGPHTIKFLRYLGCEVVSLNCETSGVFTHPPEPKPENLTQLSEFINENGADIGFALDPDADRLVVADENGRVISEELTLAFCVYHYLKNYNKSDVVINTSTSRVIEDISQNFGCKVFRVPTGEINVTEKMESLGAKIGGEGNGGIILLELNKCRDSLVGIALILEMLAKEKTTIGKMTNKMPEYVFIKEKISSENCNFGKIIDKIKIEFKDQNIDTQDGLRIDFGDRWVLIRKSNTEPIIRIFAEAKNKNESMELINKFKDICV